MSTTFFKVFLEILKKVGFFAHFWSQFGQPIRVFAIFEPN